MNIKKSFLARAQALAPSATMAEVEESLRHGAEVKGLAAQAVSQIPGNSPCREGILSALRGGDNSYVVLAAALAAAKTGRIPAQPRRVYTPAEKAARAADRRGRQLARAQACQAAKGANPQPPKWGGGKSQKTRKAA